MSKFVKFVSFIGIILLLAACGKSSGSENTKITVAASPAPMVMSLNMLKKK